MNDEYESLLARLRARRSIREFLDLPVAREDLARLFEAARWAPSNHNRQPWRFLVLEDRARIAALAAGVGHRLGELAESLSSVAAPHAQELVRHATVFGRAPIVIVALHRRPVQLAQPLMREAETPVLVSGEPLSVAMAVQNLLLAATALGLGTCVLTAPLLARSAVESALALPAGCEPTCFVAVGYPAETPPPPRRKESGLIVEYLDSPTSP